MKCEAIFANRALYSVAKMCRALQIKQCDYYQWLRYQKRRQQRKETERAVADKVRKVFEENKELYGCRKMRVALINEGVTLSEWKTRRIMRENRAGHKVLTKMKCTCPAPKFMLAHKLPYQNSSLTERAKATEYTAKTLFREIFLLKR